MSWYRPITGAFAAFTAAYFHPQSKFYHAKELIGNMDEAISELLRLQYPDGTLDSGGNRQSPPDTGFYLEALCPAAVVLDRQNAKEMTPVNDKLKNFMRKAGEGIRTGGIHTPNHRWVVSSVLAQLYSIFKDEKYLTRMDEWLAEGIYQNKDGNYPERSRNYARVENNAFITIGRLLNRPELFEIAKKNLITTYYYMESDGYLVSLDSRRQDQNKPVSIALYYMDYRFLANYYQDEMLGAVTKKIESLPEFDRLVLSRSLINFMEDSSLLQKVKAGSELPITYTKFFTGSDLVRIRRGSITASIFGGTDKPLIVASGRSCNPTFFTFRKGEASLDYVRLSTSFFSTGYFMSDGLKKDDNRYTLQEKKEAYYYLPLPEDKRNPEGDYKHTESLDHRFWSKLDFPSRPKDTLTLDTKIEITEENGHFQMDISVDGPGDVNITMDFCFGKDGELQGIEAAQEKDDYFFKDEIVKYKKGEDVIEIGPGKSEHRMLRGLDGEVYSTHFGTLKGEGMHVYLTGVTPFKHTLSIK